jgi:hypothetical protein
MPLLAPAAVLLVQRLIKPPCPELTLPPAVQRAAE